MRTVSVSCSLLLYTAIIIWAYTVFARGGNMADGLEQLAQDVGLCKMTTCDGNPATVMFAVLLALHIAWSSFMTWWWHYYEAGTLVFPISDLNLMLVMWIVVYAESFRRAWLKMEQGEALARYAECQEQHPYSYLWSCGSYLASSS